LLSARWFPVSLSLELRHA